MNISLSPYAVRYKTHDGAEVLTLVESPDAQAGLLRDLLLDDILAEAEALAFVKDVSLTWRVRREFVEGAVKEYLDGERDLDEVNAMLRPLSPGLLDDAEAEAVVNEAEARGETAHMAWFCARTTRIEELAELMDRAAKTGGLLDVGDRNLDAEDRQRDWLIRVLAGQEEHSGQDAPCHRCARVVRAEPAVRDLDDNTTTETRKDAAA